MPHHLTDRPRTPGLFSRRAHVLTLCALAIFTCGCPSLNELPGQSPVQEVKAEETGAPFLLYVPSTYSSLKAWPLVVLCHGTIPYDTPQLQMREWASFAETKGIIVAAPHLAATKGDFPPPPDRQIALQKQDEQTILKLVSTLKGRYKIAEDQVFLTGWSAGAYDILYAGLRHPEIFRALAIRQGSFDKRFMDIPADRFDRWQPIKVIYGSTDFIRDQTKDCVQWLRDQKLFVEELELPGTHRRIDPKFVWEFCSKITRERPWIRLTARAVDPAQPLAVQFSLDTVPPATRQRWDFGDKSEESRDASPVHTYAKPGRYEVTVGVTLKGGKKFNRKRAIQVGVPREN
ncbi:MAG TPA: PKD domain-containing protein [Phycisphaerae bacterium]|nr:PKD domain-containing protein [Phycisphaerae bacterium]